MKGGANLEDQVSIRRAVLAAAEAGEPLDAARLAANLNIPLDCCISFIEHYEKKEGVILPSAAPVPAKKGKSKPAAEASAEEFFQ